MSDGARWDARYQERAAPTTFGASAALRSVERWLPSQGSVLDVAGGDGVHAVWFASRGLRVTLLDASAVALTRASALAAHHQLPLSVEHRDLERDALPPGPWAAVLCCNFVHRPMWSAVAKLLAPGGVGIWLHPTLRNLERHEKPSARFLLAEHEARTLFEDAGFERLSCQTDWVGDPARHMVRIVGRRSGQPNNTGVPAA